MDIDPADFDLSGQAVAVADNDVRLLERNLNVLAVRLHMVGEREERPQLLAYATAVEIAVRRLQMVKEALQPLIAACLVANLETGETAAELEERMGDDTDEAPLLSEVAQEFKGLRSAMREAVARKTALSNERLARDLPHELALTFKSTEAAELWLDAPLPYLGGQTPAQMIAQGKTARVLAALQALAYGAFV